MSHDLKEHSYLNWPREVVGRNFVFLRLISNMLSFQVVNWGINCSHRPSYAKISIYLQIYISTRNIILRIIAKYNSNIFRPQDFEHKR